MNLLCLPPPRTSTQRRHTHSAAASCFCSPNPIQLLHLSVGLLAFCFLRDAVDPATNGESSSHCKGYGGNKITRHRVTVMEFGAVGDGVSLNTKAFQNAMFYLQFVRRLGRGGAVGPRGSVVNGKLRPDQPPNPVFSMDEDSVDWWNVDPLPSYGWGRELPGNRHKSLIFFS